MVCNKEVDALIKKTPSQNFRSGQQTFPLHASAKVRHAASLDQPAHFDVKLTSTQLSSAQRQRPRFTLRDIGTRTTTSRARPAHALQAIPSVLFTTLSSALKPPQFPPPFSQLTRSRSASYH